MNMTMHTGDGFRAPLPEPVSPPSRGLLKPQSAGWRCNRHRESTDRAAEAEQILSSNNGKVRYEDVAATDLENANYRDAGVLRMPTTGPPR